MGSRGCPFGYGLDRLRAQAAAGGYGRGGRQRIETDTVTILTGTWQNTSIGAPIALQVINKDYKLERLGDLERPRPGTAI